MENNFKNWLPAKVTFAKNIENNVTILFIDNKSKQVEKLLNQFMNIEGAKELDILINPDFEVEF